MKKIVSSTLLFIMLSSNIVHAISNDITLSNTTLNEKIKIIDNNEIIYMSTNQVIDVTNNTEVLDENGDPIRLLGDGVTDETDKIEKLIEYAISQGRELYFPEGIYKITRDIDLSKVRLPNSSSFKISGDKDGLSIFDGTFNTEKMLRLIHSGYSGETDCVQIENIVFNNMGIEITQRTKKEVIIKNNIFMNGNYTREKNSDGSISKATMEPYIVAKNTKYTVENNIFLRGTNYPGRGIATYRSENTNISNNFFGDLDSIDDAARMLPTEVISRLAIIKDSNLVEGHQGNFFTAINNERYDTNVLISNNYFDMVKTRNILSDFPNDVPVHGINVEKEEQRRDHIIYSKCYENLNIVGNYFKGMENGAAGGVKIRNGKNAYVGSNYFDDVPLLTYIYG
ncbi:MAG: glycosyl hydrolase family 28-related protein, partial [Clostridium sp.]